LIEDTHTSIDMFRHGWTSRYVNEPGEQLSSCTHQPDSIAWRIKQVRAPPPPLLSLVVLQIEDSVRLSARCSSHTRTPARQHRVAHQAALLQVLRWHQGAVQLLFYKGISYTSFGGKFPTVWHRVYAFDQATYYLQAIPGYLLLLMPIIYGVTGESPFNTDVAEFFLFFTPYVVSAMLPTLISGAWRNVDADRLQRDEQVWLSTTYVQIYAFLSMLWTSLRCQKHENAWAVKAPVWPLFAVFAGEFAALGGALFWVAHFGFDNWAQNLISVVASALLAVYALWPMVALQMRWRAPSAYHLKVLVWAALGALVVGVDYLSRLARRDERPIGAASLLLAQVALAVRAYEWRA
ncbi:hypothetical protein JKP88DRAFT_250206, partial [Tribonema minus]